MLAPSSGTAPWRKDLEEAARLRAAEGPSSLLTWALVGCYLLEKAFPVCELELHPRADPAMVASELRFSQGTKTGKRGTGVAKQDSEGQKDSPADCLSQNTENMDCLAHVLHVLCFTLALFFATMNGSPGSMGTNNSLGLPEELIQGS